MSKISFLKTAALFLVISFVTKLFLDIPFLGISLLLTVFCFAYFFCKPSHIGIAIAVLASGLIPYNKLPSFSVLGGSLYIIDLITIVLACTLMLKSFTNYSHTPSFKKNRLLKPISVLYLLVAIALLRSVISQANGGAHLILRDIRPFLYFIVMYIVLIKTIKNERDYQNLIRGFVSIGILIGIAQILESKFNLGFTAAWIREPRVEGGIELGGIKRVSVPGLSFLIFSIYYLIQDLLNECKRKFIKFLGLIICLLGILVAFGRMRFFSLFIGLIILAFFLKQKQRRKLLFLSFGTICLVIFSCFVLFNVGSESIKRRLLSTFEMSTYYGTSLTARFYENLDAINSIKQNPVLGIGFGKDYRGSGLLKTRFSGDFTYIHNGYFYILIKFGIIALLPLFWIGAVFFRNCINGCRYLSGFNLIVNIASFITMISIMIMSFTQAEIGHFPAMTLIALLLYISEPINNLVLRVNGTN